jgi:hypothetical protein
MTKQQKTAPESAQLPRTVEVATTSPHAFVVQAIAKARLGYTLNESAFLMLTPTFCAASFVREPEEVAA